MKHFSFFVSIVAVAVLGVGAYGCSLAQAQGTDNGPSDNKRTISVSGSGSVRVKPDIATATLGISKSAPKLPEAKSATDSSIAQVKAAIKKAGVADDDIQTVQYQIYRVPANPQAGIRESSWKVVHMMNVRTKKPDTIAAIVDAAVAAGATDVQNISFSVDSLAKHREKARELAVQAAREKAQQLAALFKVGLGDVLSIAEQGDYYPVQYAMNESITAGVGYGRGSDISGGQIEVSTSAQVVFAIK